MALYNFVKKLNWRLMLIHSVACVFFIYAFKQLFILHDIEFLTALSGNNFKGVHHDEVLRITNDLLWWNISGSIGLLLAFFISLTICILKKWFWLNPVIMLLITVLLLRSHLLGVEYAPIIRYSSRKLFYLSSYWYCVINGVELLTLGLLIFFSKVSMWFIRRSLPKTAENDPLLQIYPLP